MTERAVHITGACSQAYAELINLKFTAEFHKEHCTTPDCNVALFSLRETARRLINFVWPQERKAAIEMWEQFPLI